MNPVGLQDLQGFEIAFVAGTLGRGGAERQLFHHVKILREIGAKVKVYCLSQGEYWEGPIMDLGVPVVCFGQSSSRRARLRSLLAALRAEPMQVIQSQHFFTNVYAAVVGSRLGIPHVGAIRSDGKLESNNMNWLLGMLSLNLPRYLAANSETAFANVRKRRFRSKFNVYLRNVIDTDHFCPPLESSNCRVVRILGVGRFIEAKRFDRFVNIIKAVRERTKQPVEALLVGEGPSMSQIRSMVEESGGACSVRLAGESNDVLKYYHQADIHLLTSDHEGMPNVVLEAMACGLPVVASDVGGVREIVVSDETGYVIPPGDLDAFIAAVLKLVENARLRRLLGEAGRRRVVQDHSIDAGRRALLRFYPTVVGE